MAKKFKCKITEENLEKDKLFRLVLAPNNILCFDMEFKLSGPEILISNDLMLLKKWYNTEFLSEYFGIPVDISVLKEQILRQIHHKILTFIALAKKSGKVHIGRKQVESELKNFKKDEYLLIQAKDSSLREKFKNNNNILELFLSSELSAALGKEKVFYLLVVGDFASKISDIAEKYEKFNE